MASIIPCAQKIFKWEGLYTNHPMDHGGPTNRGVTISTWKQCGYDKDGDGDIDSDDIRLLTLQDATMVLRRFYWDRWQADRIINQSIADILVDWVWASGKWGIIIPQKMLGVVADGIVGEKTLQAVNSQCRECFFDDLVSAREIFLQEIVDRDPSQKVFLKGWLNRLNDFKFTI